MNTNDIRELTMDETNSVSGGNIIAQIVFGYVAEAVLDKLAGKGAVLKLVEKAYEEKTGKKPQ